MSFLRPLLWVHAVSFVATVGSAAPDAIEFNRDVRPILSDNCFHCHGQDTGTRKGGLRLDVRDAALKGGKSGVPALVPGKPEESELLLRAMSPHDDEQMPPADSNKARLSATDLAKLKAWIAGGAEYQDHWAFIPPRQAPIPNGSSAVGATRSPRPSGTPQTTRTNHAGNAIDQFVSARLQREGLSLSAEADAETLCRRLYLDVTGLPPSPADVAAFKREGFDATLEKLLQSEAYGEKWARLWLDAARYSDSNGYEKDLPREQWAWRDWVIRSINSDQPYNQFIVEQIAGDLLPNATQDQIVATGFLRNSMTNEEGAIVTEQFRTEEIFDRMDCVGKAVLGLTLSCAQCHTHKFDPIEHDEYFGLFAFINDTYEAQSWVYTKDQQQQVADVERAIAILEERVRAQQPNWGQDIAAWETSVREKQIAWTPLTATEMGSNSGLNHPTQNADASIFVLGHPSTRGTIYVIATPELRGATGLRLEALTHRDLPFNGPGRSKYGTWALSELTVTVQTPGTSEWVPVRLKNATTDFAESAAKLEEDWDADFDKEKKRTRGPVEFLIDGNKDTGWRADRGPGLRNQESVAVVQFECPLEYPVGTKFRVMMAMDHGGSDNGRHNTILGRLRLSLTGAPDPKALAIDHAAILALSVPSGQRSLAEQQAIFTAWRQSLPEAASLTGEFAAVWKTYPKAPTSVLHLAQRAPHETRETRLLDRGGWDQPKHVVPPGTPAALHPFPADRPRNRLGLAEWLVDRRSPLTARVAVNRVWQAVFGQGLAETPEDFGTRAPIPVYLDLLDWLSVDFMDHGWSQKRLLRTLLSSAVYRQSSRPTPELLERDPRNVLLARGPRFRLEAEVLRDTALKVAGLLTEQVGGPSIFPPVPASVLDYNFTKPTYWKPATGPDRYRRALYMFRKRSMPDPVLNVFDAPNGDLACVRRARSNTPLAALTSLNEPIFVEAAQALALRILREGGSTDAERADFAYRLCTSRPIKPSEHEPIATLLRDTRARLAEGWLNARELATGDASRMPALPPGTTPQDAAAWTVVARVLLNLDETLNKS